MKLGSILSMLLTVISFASAAAETPREYFRADANWKFQQADAAGFQSVKFNDAGWRAVTLPHDWSIEGSFSKTNPMGGAGGFLPAGVGCYRYSFNVPESWRGRSVSVEFEGVYMNSTVWLNGKELAHQPYGYTSFQVDLTSELKFGETNVLAVRVDNSKQKNSRWYSGSGIYRPVWFTVTAPVHVKPWGVFIQTPEVSTARAKVAVQTEISNDSESKAEISVRTILVNANGVEVGRAESSITVNPRGAQSVIQEITVAKPELWSPETPHLYRATTELIDHLQTIDQLETPFGVRTIAWSSQNGFQLNGQTIKLFGGCVHHDNGPLGAAAFDRAEERKIELLKAAGFNAVRTSHNPPSPAFLNACDRLGLLVIDEAFDCWEKGKNAQDYHVYFKDWWQRDLDTMLLRDRNHPSVVMWSIGNELEERGDESGARIARQLANRVRELDRSRPVTVALCRFKGRKPWSDTDKVFEAVDIAGYNYMVQEHAKDRQRAPDRIIVTTESFPKDAFENWRYCMENSYIVGEFVWTAQDYIGENGIGRVQYVKEGERKSGKHGQDDLFPWHGAVCGDIDICGHRKPLSHYRNIIWDRGEKLHLTVVEPVPDGMKRDVTSWGATPTRDSWTWPGQEGNPMTVEVYSRCDAVRLFLNDKLIGERPTTEAQRFKANFNVPYAPGTLKAVGMKDGKPFEEKLLTTAGPARKV
ncbi:MAG: glycoside hydrolase family 2 TIM barrel-domain containing protein, partial [Verrucomicrobiota bacterium]